MANEFDWLRRARRLHALGATGLFYSKDEFSRERYQEIADIALEMLADVGNLPVEKVIDLFAEQPGYRTPKIEVRGALIVSNKILLVQEKSDGLWALPGGFADVGLSGGENVEKEISEEANLKVKVARLYAVRHKAKHEYSPDLRDFYKLNYLCEPVDNALPKVGLETADVGFFSLDSLPPLSRGRTIPLDLEQAFQAEANTHLPVFFD